MSVERIWRENTYYDWSPDGSKIVLLDKNTGFRWNGITVIEVTKH